MASRNVLGVRDTQSETAIMIMLSDIWSIENRRDVLAPRDVGRERHGRGAAASSPASSRNVRVARIPSWTPQMTRHPAARGDKRWTS